MRNRPLRLSEQRIVAELRGHGTLTRADLARLTALPKTTVAGLVTRLLQAGVLVETPAGRDAAALPGRPATRLTLPVPGHVGVLALSHTATRVAVLDFAGRILVRRNAQRDIPRDPPDRIGSALPLLEDAVSAWPGEGGGLACAVAAVPVPFRPSRGAIPLRAARTGPQRRIAELRDASLEQYGDPTERLRKHFGAPALVDNDANLGALGEAAFGAGRGLDSLVYVKIVEGIGAGLILDGRLYRGTSGVAGELSHVHVRDDGPLCLCGARGCLATQFDAPSLLANIQAAYQNPITFDDVIALAAHGDASVCRILGDLGRTLGPVLADLCMMLNPAGIVVDGMLGQAAAPVVEGIRESIDRRTPDMVSRTVRVLPGSLGDRAELLGAVALARAEDLARRPRPTDG